MGSREENCVHYELPCRYTILKSHEEDWKYDTTSLTTYEHLLYGQDADAWYTY